MTDLQLIQIIWWRLRWLWERSQANNAMGSADEDKSGTYNSFGTTPAWSRLQQLSDFSWLIMWSVVSSVEHLKFPCLEGLKGALYFHASLNASRLDCSQPHTCSISTGCCDSAFWSFLLDFLHFTGAGEDLTLAASTKFLRFEGDWGVIREHQRCIIEGQRRSGKLEEQEKTRRVTFRGCQEAETLQSPSLQIVLIFWMQTFLMPG